ncbi:MAG: secondary thiamine-phosphate synthase enzyme YjbQ [Planctomycetota bacterium]
MAVESHNFQVRTRGRTQVIDLSEQLRQVMAGSAIKDGTVTVFVVGSTAGLTTTEAEPGLLDHDLKAAFERLAPEGARYAHEATWHDDNGHSHVCASLLGPAITIPLVHGVLTLGTWQQVVLIDFDTGPRERQIIVQVMGE